MYINKTRDTFWKSFGDLPKKIQDGATVRYNKFKESGSDTTFHSVNVKYPGNLEHFAIYAPNRNYRAICFQLPKGTLHWWWIGTHEEYNKKLK